MTYQRLVEDINTVALDLDDTRVMLLTRPKELQRSISILGTIQDKKLLIELMVPMVERNVYILKKIIPLPIRNREGVVALDLETRDHLVQNISRVFIPLKNTDLVQIHVTKYQTRNYCAILKEKHISWMIRPANQTYYSKRKTNKKL